VLELKNVSAGYGKADIIHNITLAAVAGQNISIIGANGCGKSTLLKVIAGLLPYSGNITLAGGDLSKMRRAEISRNIAMLSQMSPLQFSYTVFDTVMMGRYVHKKSTFFIPGLLRRQHKSVGMENPKADFSHFAQRDAHDTAIVEQCLRSVDMLDMHGHDITQLSGGQLQRVFLARTLAQDPHIILLDEPTNHLDLRYQIELIDYLRTWATKNNRIVVGVMHDINHAMRLGDYIIAMQAGSIVAQGISTKVLTPKLLQDIYGINVAGYMQETLRRWDGVR